MSKLSGHIHRFIGLVLLMAVLTVGWSCNEKDVPIVIDEDEIAKLLGGAIEAKELFTVSGFFIPHDYTVPFDSGVYRDSLLKTSRMLDFLKVTPSLPDAQLPDYGNLGRVRDALVKITDSFTVQTVRTYTDTVLVDTSDRRLNRYAILLKLGNDNQAYVGWLLWGFNGLGTVTPRVLSEVERFDLSTFRGDLSAYTKSLNSVPYIQLQDIDSVVTGSRLVLRLIGKTGTPTGLYHKLSAIDTSGFFNHRMVEVDTVGIDTIYTSSSNPRRWNILYVQDFSDVDGAFFGSYCIPYQK